MMIAVIGGGAAGFFAAINCAETFPGHSVFLFEKSAKILSKVRVSGGGRCNVTHACFDNSQLVEYYPRGRKELRNAFSRFSTKDTINWFENRGVKLKTEDDGRMFPVTNNSSTIIQCLTTQATENNVKLELNHSLQKISLTDKGKFILLFQNGNQAEFDRIIITTGGSVNKKGYDWLMDLGHTIVSPVPSLFTFNLPHSPLKGLEGIATVAEVKLEGFNFVSTGPLLITHWGISGPAVLKLSAFAARWLNEKNYSATCLVNWFPELSEEEIREHLYSLKQYNAQKKLSTTNFEGLSGRLWQLILNLSGIDDNDRVADISKAEINKLVSTCCHLQLNISGKTTFKEEFVTCGGVSLKEVNMQTMESMIRKGIYFAGEVLDIDGITGGFNFQSAWTTGYLAGINAGR